MAQSLSRRLSLFGFGFLIGIILLTFFYRKKNTEFNYSPQARVKSSLLSKSEIRYETSYLENIFTDSLVKDIIELGKVDFKKSQTNRDECNIYHITYQIQNFIEIENCADYIRLLSTSQ